MRKPTAEAFGAVLHELRSQRGLSQEDLAYRSERSPGQVSKLEGGKSAPNLTTVMLLAETLELRASTIVEWVERRMDDGSLPPPDSVPPPTPPDTPAG